MGDSEGYPAAPQPKTPRTAASVSSSARSEDNDDDPDQAPKRARRTFLTQNACQRCRLKKSKCDGKRPICASCEKNGVECVYDAAREGLTRMQNLQQQLETRTNDHARLQSLFAALEHSTDQQATTLLARLRMGASVDDLLQLLEGVQISSSRMVDGILSQDGSSATSSASYPHPIDFNYEPPQNNAGYTQAWPQEYGQGIRSQAVGLQLHPFPQHPDGHDYQFQQMAVGQMGQTQQEQSAMEVQMWHEQAGMVPSGRPTTHEVQQRTEPAPPPPNQSSSNTPSSNSRQRPYQDGAPKRRP